MLPSLVADRLKKESEDLRRQSRANLLRGIVFGIVCGVGGCVGAHHLLFNGRNAQHVPIDEGIELTRETDEQRRIAGEVIVWRITERGARALRNVANGDDKAAQYARIHLQDLRAAIADDKEGK